MNFLLNKIDTDLRKKVYEKTEDGEVHRKSNISVNKDSEKQEKKFFNEYVKEERKQIEQNKFIVDATKLEKPTINLHDEKEENLHAIGYGAFLDIEK